MLAREVLRIGFSVVPFVGLLDVLWPLWDARNQALHDKAAGTAVMWAGAVDADG